MTSTFVPPQPEHIVAAHHRLGEYFGALALARYCQTLHDEDTGTRPETKAELDAAGEEDGGWAGKV